jgi:hypothetical protein
MLTCPNKKCQAKIYQLLLMYGKFVKRESSIYQDWMENHFLSMLLMVRKVSQETQGLVVEIFLALR